MQRFMPLPPRGHLEMVVCQASDRSGREEGKIGCQNPHDALVHQIACESDGQVNQEEQRGCHHSHESELLHGNKHHLIYRGDCVHDLTGGEENEGGRREQVFVLCPLVVLRAIDDDARAIEEEVRRSQSAPEARHTSREGDKANERARGRRIAPLHAAKEPRAHEGDQVPSGAREVVGDPGELVDKSENGSGHHAEPHRQNQGDEVPRHCENTPRARPRYCRGERGENVLAVFLCAKGTAPNAVLVVVWEAQKHNAGDCVNRFGSHNGIGVGKETRLLVHPDDDHSIRRSEQDCDERQRHEMHQANEHPCERAAEDPKPKD
mmetsp:Transcript_20246/g.51396  ORF Transcript_20246/g.51396 Transcript_20246/m.51396 type:complete len:321 (+) Transcript_20246:489-1451(+)